MIVVLCHDFDDAQFYFEMLCAFFDRYEPMYLVDENPHALRAVGDDDIVYIFAHEKLGGVFNPDICDVTDPEVFFENLFNSYDEDIVEDFMYGAVSW